MKTLTGKLRSRKNVLIGQVEQVILLAILHRLNNAYGIEIKDEIENRIGVKLTVGALYSTLDRMVQKDILTCIDAEVDNSKSRKYFSVTQRGRYLLHESIEIAKKMRGDVDILAIPGVATVGCLEF
jgi:PadR family transcriptional regulator PadR